VSTTTDLETKQQVRQFYDRIGWQQVGECCYQNARYEDLRPVSQEYVHRCHMRVVRHLSPRGRFLLDAGSGPIQYPEYLEYSNGYQYRVCADISYIALQEARVRVGEHGLYVVSDVANLPFKPDTFEGIVSLHTIQHLPPDEYLRGYQEVYRVLAPSCSAVVVNRWRSSFLMSLFSPIIRVAVRLLRFYRRITRRPILSDVGKSDAGEADAPSPKKTFIHRHNAAWLKREVGILIPMDILVWRSVSTRFLHD